MSALAKAIEARTNKAGGTCRVGSLIDQLTNEDQDLCLDFISFVNNRTVFATAIAAAMKDLGHVIGSESIQRHRRAQCQCGEGA